MAATRQHASPMYKGTNAERAALSFPSDQRLLFFYETDTDDLYRWNGTGWVKIDAASGVSSETYPAQGRLTLESGVPISTSDQSAKTTLYFTPYKGNAIALYDGAAWTTVTFSEVSISLAGKTADTNYDVFAYLDSGAPVLEILDWTDATTRATALTTLAGIYVKSGANTRRYLGTIRINSSGGQCEDTETKRFVWNYCNRIDKRLVMFTPNGDIAYSTASYQYYNNNSAYKVEYVCGLAEDVWDISVWALVETDGSSRWNWTSIGYDSSSATLHDMLRVRCDTTVRSAIGASWKFRSGIGYHYLALIQYAGGGQSTWERAGLNAALPC